VESQGWAVFGRLGNNLQKVQLLSSLNSDWKEGPPLISDLQAHKQGQCIFQVFFMVQGRNSQNFISKFLKIFITFSLYKKVVSKNRA
jgi:hypothetical protein